MKKIVLLFGLFLCVQVQANDAKFEVAFKSKSHSSVKAGETVEVNWWTEKAPTAGRVQLFLSGTTDKGVNIVSSGFYKGNNILTDQIGKTASGTESFATDQLPSGTYRLEAYICDYQIYACSADRYSLNRHKSNTLTLKIENKNSHYLDFNDEDLLRKSFEVDQAINFRWFSENYKTGFLSFKLEGGDGTIYDIVHDSTKNNEARNDTGSVRDTRQQNFENRFFQWTGVTEGLNNKYKLNEDSPYFGKSVELRSGLYRILMYVHRDFGSGSKTESYIIKSIPFNLRSKEQVTPTVSKDKTPASPSNEIPKDLPEDAQSNVEKKIDLKAIEKSREGLSTAKKNRTMNRRQLLSLYKNQTSSSAPTKKNSNLSLFERIKKQKQKQNKSQTRATSTRLTRNIRSHRITQRSSLFTR